MECVYCKKICKNDNSLRNHQRLCKLNPNKQIIKSNFIEYNNKVKNGETPKSATNQHTKAKLNGTTYIVSDTTKLKLSKANKGKKHTIASIEKLKISMRKAVLDNPDSYTASNVSGRTPIIMYNGFKLKGTWELETAKWLDSQNIKWTNILKGFDYEWQGSTHIYYPDFYLIDYNKYIEVKGYERERDRIKWNTIKDLIVIKKNEIDMIKKGTYQLYI